MNPTRNNKNEETDNISYLDIFARGFLFGRHYALSQSGQAEESLVVPTTLATFTTLPLSYNKVVRESR